ncbi:MAG: hypothetical protein LPK12_07180 [Rhodobacterales bacterium]|nr:hypothetical protein [Rhodobacterales bacterium]MDX5499762.1 hypothetical protein [Rhodobacterales bacterium]
MKSVLLGCLIAVVLAIAAQMVLDREQIDAQTVYSTVGVRLTAAGD